MAVAKKRSSASSFNSRRRVPATVGIGLAATIVLLLLFACSSTVPDYLDALGSDLVVYTRNHARPTGDVVIAAIDGRSIARFGRWPWTRVVERQLVQALGRYRVSVVGFDMVFSEPESPLSDSAFAQSLGDGSPVYLGYFFNTNLPSEDVGLTSYRTVALDPPPLSYNLVRKTGPVIREPPLASAYLPSIPELNRAAAGNAYLQVDEDVDSAVRSYPTVIRFDNLYCVPLFLAVADAYLGHPALRLVLSSYGVVGVWVGRRAIPVDQVGRTMLRYRGPAGTLARYSVADIMAGRLPLRALQGKIVLVGVTASGLGDRFATPLGGNFPGVEIQATAVDNVLAGDLIAHCSLGEEIIGSFILGLVLSCAAAFSSAAVSLIVMLALAAIYFEYTLLRLSYDATFVGVGMAWLTLLITYLATASYRYVAEGSEKRYIRSAFELYLNPEVISAIVEDPAALKLGGQRRHLSILFADIVDFTARAENSEPEALVALLNTFMTAMTNVILAGGGVVDKLMGDGIMAFWGAPVRNGNPARQAMSCALEMCEELRGLAKRDPRFKEMRIGIGIATGEAVVGNMGGENRFDYSAIGDRVNLASRLEGLTRFFQARILADRLTLQEAGEGFVARQIGLVQVKGKQEAVPVVEVGDAAEAPYYARFATAVATMRSGGSAAGLRQLLNERPDDRVAALWLERMHLVNGSTPEVLFEFDMK